MKMYDPYEIYLSPNINKNCLIFTNYLIVLNQNINLYDDMFFDFASAEGVDDHGEPALDIVDGSTDMVQCYGNQIASVNFSTWYRWCFDYFRKWDDSDFGKDWFSSDSWKGWFGFWDS